MSNHKTTMYKQGNSYVVSRWSETKQAFVLSENIPYAWARQTCKADNGTTTKTIVDRTADGKPIYA